MWKGDLTCAVDRDQQRWATSPAGEPMAIASRAQAPVTFPAPSGPLEAVSLKDCRGTYVFQCPAANSLRLATHCSFPAPPCGALELKCS